MVQQVMRLKRHPLSEVFGDMPPADFDDLKKDIEDNGLRQRIMLYEGKVLDGWHRYRALCELGIFDKKEQVDDYDTEIDGEDPKKYVYALNLFRRQLPPEERVRLAADALGYKPSRGGTKAGATRAEVAKMAGVSEASVTRAMNKQKEKAPPTLESLQKLLKMAEGRVASIKAQIADLQSTAKPKKEITRTGPARYRRSQ